MEEMLLGCLAVFGGILMSFGLMLLALLFYMVVALAGCVIVYPLSMAISYAFSLNYLTFLQTYVISFVIVYVFSLFRRG